MGARILVVEDNADLHLGLALRLKSVGHEVLSALTGAEAISLARREQPDIMLLDVGLPDMSGHDVAQDISAHESTQRIPIIYLTARHEVDHRVQAAHRGASAYLVKPTMPPQLFAAIDAALIAGRVRAEA